MSDQFHASPLYARERTPVPLNRRLDGPQSHSRHFGEQKNRLSLSGFKPRIFQPVA